MRFNAGRRGLASRFTCNSLPYRRGLCTKIALRGNSVGGHYKMHGMFKSMTTDHQVTYECLAGGSSQPRTKQIKIWLPGRILPSPRTSMRIHARRQGLLSQVVCFSASIIGHR